MGGKKSLLCAADLLDYVGEAYSIESILEAVLRFLQNRRHASLDVATDPTSLVRGITMNREYRRRRAGAIDVQKSYSLGGAREPARAVLAARRVDKACLSEFRERFPHEGGVGI